MNRKKNKNITKQIKLYNIGAITGKDSPFVIYLELPNTIKCFGVELAINPQARLPDLVALRAKINSAIADIKARPNP